MKDKIRNKLSTADEIDCSIIANSLVKLSAAVVSLCQGYHNRLIPESLCYYSHSQS